MPAFWNTPLIDDLKEHKLDNQSYEIVNQIDADRTHGASQLAVLALEGLQALAELWQGDNVDEFCQDLQVLIDELRSVRPSMVAIANLMDGFQRQFQHIGKARLSDVRESVINIAGQLKEDTRHASEQTAVEVAELINENEVLMTHSLSSMIKRVFTLVRERSVKAIVTESRPGNEGLLLAEFLSSLEIETCYVTDAQIGLWVPQADKIIIGADSILSDGAVVNKSGTSLLALAARESDIPVYVCCERFKWADVNRDQIELEEMDPEELGLPPMEYVVARNIYFDITPAELITAWVSELGVEYEW
ncbi:MAG: translation initiation factor eIF-2B [Gammaproteobacteria bacterium]|nr:translation initiation factor eIF-2B [Gammaproteobacteria bacterium]